MRKLQDILQEEMKDPEFKEEFDELEQDFQWAKSFLGLRKENGLSQKELAELAHTSQSYS